MRFALLLALVLALPVAAAQAYIPDGATIVSASLELREQGDEASTSGDISADGRYVVFDTRARNLFPPTFADPPGAHYDGGVMRRDLATGRLELVAPGDVVGNADGAVQVRGARNPSVSGDGRYVAFSTGQRLVPEDVNGNIDVYVRDLQTGAYELVSARDGGSVPASYAARDPDTPLRNPGSDVSAGVAISADGDRVLFRTVDLESDLADPVTPPYQLFVRVRSTKRTVLITKRDDGSPAGGANFGGVLSADGSTVAWPGFNADVQTRFLDGENPDSTYYYYLWRRVDSGSTRRITGMAEPEVPGCTFDSNPFVKGPCYGPLSEREQSVVGIATTLPALSADGRRVLFITGAPQRPPTGGLASDLWVTDMTEGRSRSAASIELTRDGGGRDPTDSAPITTVALSPDGRWAGIVTQRTRFLLPTLRLINQPTNVPGTDELFLVDLDAGTIERALHAGNGGNADGGVAAPLSISQDGRRIVFGSSADNLFFGDANQRADVFVIDRLDGEPPPPVEPDPPAEAPFEAFDPPPAPTTKLRVTVRRAPKGRVRIQLRAPRKGSLVVSVRGRVPDGDGRLRGPARLLGSARKRVKKSGSVTVEVKLARRYRTAARRAKKLDGRATVTLTPESGAPLSGNVAVRFAAP